MQNKYRRFFSHYTFIYPDLFLKNVVVELNNEGRISLVFPFEREIENTEFYSGKLIFLPVGIDMNDLAILATSEYKTITDLILLQNSDIQIVFNEQGLKL